MNSCTQRSKTEEYKEGRSLLERCDKLLHSIAEMNAAELQPSPVSVLDSSFYKDESSSPSPVMKRSISFTGRHKTITCNSSFSVVRFHCVMALDDPVGSRVDSDVVYSFRLLLNLHESQR